MKKTPIKRKRMSNKKKTALKNLAEAIRYWYLYSLGNRKLLLSLTKKLSRELSKYYEVDENYLLGLCHIG